MTENRRRMRSCLICCGRRSSYRTWQRLCPAFGVRNHGDRWAWQSLYLDVFGVMPANKKG